MNEQVARDYHRELVSDRGMDMEAQFLEIIQELQQYGEVLAIKEIAARFIERHGEDFEPKSRRTGSGTLSGRSWDSRLKSATAAM